MRLFPTLSLRQKLMAIMTLTSVIVLLVASALFIAKEVFQFRTHMRAELKTLTDVVGMHSRAALVFEDQEAAQATLEGLRAVPHIVAAALYTKDGQVFAVYSRSNTPDSPFSWESQEAESHRAILQAPLGADDPCSTPWRWKARTSGTASERRAEQTATSPNQHGGIDMQCDAAGHGRW